MTSKEKLADIQYLINEFYSTEEDRNGLSESAKESRKIFNQDCRDIAEDLEILDILKKNPDILIACKKYKTAQEWFSKRKVLALNCTYNKLENMFNKVKAWLEHE